MGTINTAKIKQLLDPANADLSGQARVNAEIFTAVEILGRKLERSEAERDRLARRLALIESSATVDEKTGKLYLPALIEGAGPVRSAPAVTPQWMVAASLMSSAVALFALGLVLFREPVPALTKEQMAVLDSLKGSQFALLAPESKGWKHLENEAPDQNTEVAAREVPAPVTTEPAAETAQAELPKQAEIPQLIDVPVVPVTPPETARAEEAEKESSQPVALVKASEENADKPVETAQTTAPQQAVEKKTAPAALGTADLPPDPALPAKLAQLEKRAYQNVPEAQHDLATLYASGKLIPQNYKRAIYWFTRSADNGVANANYNLGVIYHQGLGAKADMKKAIGWYEKAAELGHPEAMYNLGISYIEGVGVKTDITKGVAYFKRAARAGVAQAAYNLGVLYESNFMGAIDKDKAVEWYQVAANEGHTDAKDAIHRLKNTATAGNNQALTLAEMTEPAAGGEEYGEGDASPADEQKSSSGLLLQMQNVLIKKGLISGPANGIMSPQTEDAIRALQKKLGMKEDGIASQALLDKAAASNINE